MKESGHERKFVSHVEDCGGRTIKLEHKKGFPDRIVLTHTNHLYWLEAKAPEGRVKKFQTYIHSVLRRFGQDVRVAYDYQEAIEQYDEICS